jgi:ribosome-binding protein aMBF1 (putative translation factor)
MKKEVNIMARRKDDFEKYLEKQLKDPEFKEEWEKLEPLYNLIEAEIKLRNKKKLSQKELAERMGTSQPAIARFERGNVSPTVDFLTKLAKALGAELELRLN